MKKAVLVCLLMLGIIGQVQSVEAATNEIDKIEYNAKDRSIPQVRWILDDIFSKLPDREK